MNLTPLPGHERLCRSAPEAGREDALTTAITELFLLQDCVARCESLASRIAGHDATGAQLCDLGECIAACHNYLAAKSRESRYEDRLRAHCAEVLAAAANSIGLLRGDDARACRRVLHAGARLLGARCFRPDSSGN